MLDAKDPFFASGGEDSHLPIQILLWMDQLRATEVCQALANELRCRTVVDSQGVLRAPQDLMPGCEVLIVEGSPQEASLGAANPGDAWLAQVLARPDAPEVIVLVTPDGEAPTAAPAADVFQVLKRPLLGGELANQVRRAAAHRRQRQSHRRAEELERLRKVSLAITSTLERKPLLELLIQEAVGLLQAKSGGIYELDADRRELTVIAEFRRPNHLGAKLKVGEGLAGRLVESGEDFVIEDDYSKSAHQAEVFSGEDRPFRAVVEVKLRWRAEILGVLYVDDDVGRRFNPEEARLLGFFAEQGAVALANSAIMAHSQARGERLKDLATAIGEIMGDLQQRELTERLDLIARHVAEVTGAEMAGVLLVRHPGNILVLEATFGERPDGAKRYREFAIESGLRTGLTGALAAAGKLVNLRHQELLDHPAVRRAEASASPAGTCFSLLAIPLTRRVGGREVLLGLLRAENKKGLDGKPHAGIGFSQDDVESMKIFADAVVVALELDEQRGWLNRLVDNSPAAVIAIDLKANVTLFSRQAEEILGYTAAEAKRMKVFPLYYDEQEPRKIGELLNESGRVSRYATAVRSRDGDRIPIRHSSTWVHDSREERIGSVGYFEDFRTIELAEKRLESLLKATSIVANATELAAGLGELTQMMAALVPHTFCRILLMEEPGDRLRVEAVQVENGGDVDHAALEAALRKPMAISEWPGFLDRLKAGRPLVLRASEESNAATLKRLSEWLGLRTPVQALLLAPLLLKQDVVGLIEFGELSSEERKVFSQDEIDFVAQIAAHTTALINRMKLLHEAQRRGDQLTALDEASRIMQAQPEPRILFQQLARLAAKLVGCEAAALFLNRPHLEELELVAQHGIPNQQQWLDEGRSQDHHQGIVGEVVRTRQLVVRLDWESSKDRDPVLRDLRLRTAAAVPLRFLGDIDAVLFLGDPTGSQRFAKAERDVLQRFAAQASIALRISELISPEMRSIGHFELLHKITDFIQHEDDPDKIMEVMLTGITAGYGLGFNRAAILLLDSASSGTRTSSAFETPVTLRGRAAIGQLTKDNAERDWEDSRQKGLDDFSSYLEQLRVTATGRTPLGSRIQSFALAIATAEPDPLSKAVIERRPVRVKRANLRDFPESFLQVFQPTSEVVVVPLEVRGEIRGLLVADNKFTGAEISAGNFETLLTFVGTLSVSLDNRRLYDGAQATSDQLRRLFALSNRITAAQRADQVLSDLLDNLPAAVDAAEVRLVLLDRLERISKQPTGRRDRVSHVSEERPGGHSMLVMNENQPAVFEDLSMTRESDRPATPHRGIRAAVGLPLRPHDSSLGVLWLYYDRPRRFEPFEIDALLLFARQAAVAFDNALRLDELERLRAAAQQISLPANLRGVLHAVARGALGLSGGSSAIVWPYDSARRTFVPADAVVAGASKRELESFIQIGEAGGPLASLVQAKGWLAVPDLASAAIDPIVQKLREPLARAGVGGFQGVALRENDDLVGVLYVNYHEAESFGDRSLLLLSAFANHACLAVKNARVHDRVSRSKKAAESVAHLTTLENLDDTLKSVAESTCEAVRCDSVVIFSYNRREDRWSYPPAYWGVQDPEKAWPEGSAPDIQGSIVGKLLEEDRPHIAPDLKLDEVLGGHSFAVDEGVAACGAWPLRAATEAVGVMFVNFGVVHPFTPEVRSDIELFADQAAVAIRNKQLFDAWREDQLLALQDFQHQIRTPIVQAHAGIKDIAAQLELAGALQQDVLTIISFCARAERVSQNIRLFASLRPREAIEANLELHPVALLTQLLKTVAAENHLLGGRFRGVAYQFEEQFVDPGQDAKLLLDPALVEHAIGNVLDNAFKYSHRDTVVHISASSPAPDQFVIVVISQGAVILAEEVEKATVRGWQSPAASFMSAEGKGIGLWIVDNIMKSLNGTVRIFPTTPEGKTEVRLTLPIVHGSQAAEKT